MKKIALVLGFLALSSLSGSCVIAVGVPSDEECWECADEVCPTCGAAPTCPDCEKQKALSAKK